MKQYTGKKIGSRYSRESLIVYGAGQTVSVDRTAGAAAWCKSRGMVPAYTVTAADEVFTVWNGIIESRIGGTFEAACAIPV